MKACGLLTNQRGGIVADEYMRTSDPNIYAVGDVVEVVDFVSNNRTMIPLAGPANKREESPNNIAGGFDKYEGTQGTAIAKVFDLVAASTGLNEKSLKASGLQKGRNMKRLL